MRLSLNRLGVLLATLLLGVSALAADADPRANARALVPLVDQVVAALDSSAPSVARERWDGFSQRWLQVEDPIRALTPALYRRIEERMQDVTGALPRSGDFQIAEARSALADLRAACVEVANLPAGPSTRGAPGAPLAQGERRASLADYVALVHEAREQARTDPATAYERAQSGWYGVEANVSALDGSAYAAAEGALAEARSGLRRHDADRVAGALDRLHATLAPLAERSGHVGALEAAAILLREGAEALLVLAAIAAFLGRIGAPEKARTVWLGGALGLAASLAGGGLLAWLFAGMAAAGERREAIEGFSSLAAAALLVLVGQWLHEKIRRGGWKKDVQSAVASGRTVSLLLVAFFAVFREGAETVLFFAGIAPASTPHEMLLGVALGLGALAVLGAVFLALGRRVPVGPFLSFATFLLWALAVKFTGGGVEALQAGGILSATRYGVLPEIPLLGFAPTIESTAAQAGMLLLWAGFTIVPRWRRTRWKAKPELSSIEA